MNKKAAIRINANVQNANLRQLSVMVILRALKELKGRDVFAALDALMWILSDDFAWWAEWAGLPHADPFHLLTSGQLRRLKA